MAKLSGPEISELCEALLPLFTQQEFESLLLFRLDKRLDLIAPKSAAFPVAVERTVKQAEEQGWTTDLLVAATSARPRDAHLQDVVARLRARLAAPEERPDCPYPGMIPFTAQDARFFYGREAEIEQMLRHLRHQRLVFIIGASGSGKSSLINAGLLPKLDPTSDRRSKLFTKGYWLARTMRPGADPMGALRDVLGGDPAQPEEAVAALLAVNPPAQRLLLVIDQFEEVFTPQVTPEARKDFLAEIEALQGVEACALLIAMRADFYPDLMNSDLWEAAKERRMEVVALRGETLKAAIVGPAEQRDVAVESALIERLLADAAGEPGVLPMLQETLVLLWAEMADRRLTLDAYEKLGEDGRSGLAVAIGTKADAVYAGLTPEGQATARRIFLRLIQFGEGREDTRRQQPEGTLRSASDDPAAFAATLDELAQNRLLTLTGEEEDGERRVDISHEALIAGWPRLQAWVKERRAAEQTRRRLEDKAAEWARLGRGEGGLLDETELPEAERWLASVDAQELGTSDDLQQLVEASRTAVQTREAVRREQLRRLRQRALIAVALAVIAVLAGIAAGGFGILSRQNAHRAEENARRASSGELAAEAQLEMAKNVPDPSLYLLLAQEAISATLPLDDYVTHNASRAIVDAIREAPPWVMNLPRQRHEGGVNSAAYSPDGARIVTAGADGTARVWEAAGGAALLTLSGHGCDENGNCGINSAAYSPDGARIVTAGGDGTARTWPSTAEVMLEMAGRQVQRYNPWLTPEERQRYGLD